MAYRGESADITVQYMTSAANNDYLFPCYCGRGDSAGDGGVAQQAVQAQLLSPHGTELTATYGL
tara:strand:+ start:179 stop:370 length:192 start_codon:yes stop_codon:yes gene_type:complete